MARKSRGRQKVEMVKMMNESNLQVTFSKRRFGLFKKANELVTLCGAEIALIVFSPGHKVYSFGHPNVETIIQRFINQSSHSGQSTADRLVEAHRLATVRQLTAELTHNEHLLDVEKKYGEVIDQRVENSPIKRWWDMKVDELNPQQLEQLKVAVENLKKDVDEGVYKLSIVQNVNSNPLLDSGLFGRNFAAYGGFNRAFPFAAREGEASTSMVHQNLGASGASSSSMSRGFDMGYGRRYF